MRSGDFHSRLVSTLLSLVLVLSFSALVQAEWVPPADPEPEQILEEARADAAARRYEDALAKHIWFHENALKIHPDLYGVRLSFALTDWVKLGKNYPPALEKLKSIRDQAGQAARDIQDPEGGRSAFQDYAAINRYLGDVAKTTELFQLLDSHQPERAAQLFDLAQTALVLSHEYALCAKYVNSEDYFRRIRKQYRDTKHIAWTKDDERLRQYAHQSFSHRSTTLVALLILDDRMVEAYQVADSAFAEWDDPQFQKELNRAKEEKFRRPGLEPKVSPIFNRLRILSLRP